MLVPVKREVLEEIHVLAALFYHIAHLQIRNHLLDMHSAAVLALESHSHNKIKTISTYVSKLSAEIPGNPAGLRSSIPLTGHS